MPSKKSDRSKSKDNGAKPRPEPKADKRSNGDWHDIWVIRPQALSDRQENRSEEIIDDSIRIRSETQDSNTSSLKEDASAARALARTIANVAATHSELSRRMTEALLTSSGAEADKCRNIDLQKIHRVAARLGIQTKGLDARESAHRIAEEALRDHSRAGKEPLGFLSGTITKKRHSSLANSGLMPHNIDDAIEAALERTSDLGHDSMASLFRGLACSIADYDSLRISTDLSDMVRGTPRLAWADDSNKLRMDRVNMALDGLAPSLVDKITKAAKRLENEAEEAGSTGIEIIIVGRNGNGLPTNKEAAEKNLTTSELALCTGLIDALVVDDQCLTANLAEVCACPGNAMKARMRFAEEDAEETAKTVVKEAIEAFKRRVPAITSRSKTEEITIGFSLEQIEALLAKLAPEDPLTYLAEALKAGRVRGIALIAGCECKSDGHNLGVVKELLKNDVLVLSAGCLAKGFASEGMFSSAAVDLYAGEGLRSFINDLSEANDFHLPAVWHVGSCADIIRAMDLATALAQRLDVDVSSIPFAVSSPGRLSENAISTGAWCMTLGAAVHIDGIDLLNRAPMVAEVLTNTARDVLGGSFIVEAEPSRAAGLLLNEVERRRWNLKLDQRYQVPKGQRLGRQQLFQKAIYGAIIATGFADQVLSSAIDRYGNDEEVEFPETAYALPSILAWQGREIRRLGDMPAALEQARAAVKANADLDGALAAGEAVMVAAEIIESLRFIRNERPYEGTAFCGFIPDKVIRELGIAIVDDTIPGCAVLVGAAEDPKRLAKIVRDCQSKGMLIFASYDTVRQLQDLGIKTGLDLRLYPIGEFTQVVHALNFAIRVALTFGGVQKGDRERLAGYLVKRPKVFVLQLGPIDAIKAGAEFAALLNGAPTITDQEIEGIPDKFVSQPAYDRLVQTAIELRGIQVRLAPVALPVAYGPAFEGETVRRPDTYVEAGGAAHTLAFEILRQKPESEVEDGKITFIGDDVDHIPEGGKTALAIVIDVYGKNMQSDFESVLERRIHQFINFAEGIWHTGQRNTIWVRISKNSVKAGFRFKHFGDILVAKIKGEFGNIVSRVQVTIITDEAEAQKLLPEAVEKYRVRDQRLAGLTDESVEDFYSCGLCSSFAPDHICIITPERLGLCGAINWLDAKASREISPTGPNQPIRKGEAVDVVKGQWVGINEAVIRLSHGKLERFNAYSLMEFPMTSCGCFEVIVAMTADAQAVIAVNREYPGMTPVGMKFSTLAGNIGGGRQTPGFIGIGRKYLLSKKFISADGGLLRVAWMPKDLKNAMANGIRKRAEELGVPDLLDKIADETITTDAEGLANWMAKVDHPALKMRSLLE
jgi:acetyl-CoA synthase